MSVALKALKKYFGYDTFRPLQGDIVKSILSGNDTLVIMPTGGGKSICYQIPALIMDGVAIVVSPLIALMKDQVEGLKANGVNAGFLNSSQTEEQQNGIIAEVKSGKIKLLYVSPERLVSQDFYYLMLQLKISLFAIDEAHCISVWGHDFRPEYTKMAYLKTQFPKTPVVALTATADGLTQKDIVKQLALNNPKRFMASFDRPNLSLTVAQGQNRLKTILQFLENRQHQPGIIYCLSRKATENLAEKLRNSGVDATFYHAGLSPEQRAGRQERFINDEVTVMCATIAFGMGIDKSNVRWVIHYNLPKNIESYYQEIGRAGRDGLRADTLLFYSFADVIVHRKFIEESAQKEVGYSKLERIQQFCDAPVCRRKILLSYFGEHLEKNCGNCDVCKNPPQQFNGTVLAQKVFSAIVRLKNSVPTGTLIDVLRGSNRQDIQAKGYHQIKTFGAGKDIAYRDWQKYILQLLNMGYINIAYDKGNALQITQQAIDVLYGRREIFLVKITDVDIKTVSKRMPQTQKQKAGEELFQVLRELRLQLSRRHRIAPYLIFSDATLRQMAAQRPTSEFEMLQISGVGDRKYEQYGEQFINEILDYVQQENRAAKQTGDSFMQTYEYFRQGFSVDEIASIRKMHAVTIYSHLASLYEKGAPIDITEFYSVTDYEQTEQMYRQLNFTDNVKQIYDAMGGMVDYYKVRLIVSYLKTRY